MAERLSNQNKTDIQRLVGEGKNSKQIAKELDKDEQTVINYVGKVAHELIRLHDNGVNAADGKPAQVDAEVPKEPMENTVPSKRKTAGFQHRDGATIMTPAAGEIADEARKHIQPKLPSTVVAKARPDGD